MKTTQQWSAKGFTLDDSFAIPTFRAELDDGPRFADFRMGWNESGFFLSLRVEGKKQPPWCRESRMEDSDGLNVWMDTRNTHNIHRASRFCHRFVFLPQSGPTTKKPIASMVGIHRAKELPKPVPRNTIRVRSEKRMDGYIMQAFVPSDAITGWDPSEHPRLGFFYAVADRELGWQTFSLGPDFPFSADPSLWGTLELID